MMLAAFCVRLALGLVAFLPLLPAAKMHPKFFRTQYLTALGLAVVAALTAWSDADGAQRWLLVGGVGVAVLGALTWTLEPAPLGRSIGVAATALFVVATVQMNPGHPDVAVPPALRAGDALTSGCLLGATVTAMLVGHSYLISPGLTIAPLVTMLAVCLAALIGRVVTLITGWMWLGEFGSPEAVWHSQWLYLLPRWTIGLGATLVFGIMAYLSARIRSTQSATGILFVVVICTLIGELFGLLLAWSVGLPL